MPLPLLERESQLQMLEASYRRVASGHGEMVFLGGEAGVGKSTLVERFLDGIAAEARTAVVSCDALAMPGPLGPLFDIAEALGPEVVGLLAAQAPRAELFRAVLRAFRAADGTTVMVGEDAHWTDEATLELVRFLGRRIGNTRVMFIIIYRNDELGPYHPLTRVLGDLTNAPDVRRIELSPLSPQGVATLAAESGLDASELHARTGGNPFFISEIIGSGAEGIPASVRDAVLARAARLSAEGRAILDASAVIGLQVDPGLLAEVIGGPIEDPVEECYSAGVLQPVHYLIGFRHAIGRDAVLASMSVPRRRALHRRVMAALERAPVTAQDLAHLAHHAEEAGDAEATRRYAEAAAREAAAFGAHREAAAQYGRALRFAATSPPGERLPLMEARAYELYLTGDLDEAVRVQREVVALWAQSDDRLREGDATRWLSRFLWFAGHSAEANQRAQEAHAVLADLPPGPELAMAQSTLSQLRMLGHDHDAAIDWGARAIALATSLGDDAILTHALINVGTARLAQEDASGEAMLERAVETGRRIGADDDVVRAITNRGWTLWWQRNREGARQLLEQGIAFATERDLVAMELYQRAIRAAIRVEEGHWKAAEEEAAAIAPLPAAIRATRILALTVLGRVRGLRQEPDDGSLARALDLARETGEYQRLVPVHLARIEAAWLAGDASDVLEDAREAFAAARAQGDRWAAGELGVWLSRAGDEVEPCGCAGPFALELAGDHAAAAAAWTSRGLPLMAARALASSGDEGDLRRVFDAFERLGATADAACVTQALREMGAKHIPRGPRASTRANAEGLTAREVEVLGLLARGATNRQIAGALYLSAKTVGHHVSAILAKLDVPTRVEAVARARDLGIVEDGDRPAAI